MYKWQSCPIFKEWVDFNYKRINCIWVYWVTLRYIIDQFEFIWIGIWTIGQSSNIELLLNMWIYKWLCTNAPFMTIACLHYRIVMIGTIAATITINTTCLAHPSPISIATDTTLRLSSSKLLPIQPPPLLVTIKNYSCWIYFSTFFLKQLISIWLRFGPNPSKSNQFNTFYYFFKATHFKQNSFCPEPVLTQTKQIPFS